MQVDPDGEYFLVEDVIELIEGARDSIKESAPKSPSESEQGVLVGGLTALRLILRALNATTPPKSGDTEVDDGA
jgi:hypothetical protein